MPDLPSARDTASPEARLVRVLGLAASYNDKGWIWRGDAPEDVEAMRAAWQREMEALAGEIDASRMPDTLRRAIRTGEAVRDGHGRYVDDACAAFGLEKP